MRPIEPAANEPREMDLFELWMGITAEEWDRLAAGRDHDPENVVEQHRRP